MQLLFHAAHFFLEPHLRCVCDYSSEGEFPAPKKSRQKEAAIFPFHYAMHLDNEKQYVVKKYTNSCGMTLYAE